MPRFSKSRAPTFLCWIAMAALAAPAISRTARAEDAVPSAAAPVSSPAQQAPRDLLHQLDDAFVSIFEKVAPAVVIIEAEKKPATDEQILKPENWHKAIFNKAEYVIYTGPGQFMFHHWVMPERTPGKGGTGTAAPKGTTGTAAPPAK